MIKLDHIARWICLLGVLSITLPSCTFLTSFEECTANTDCPGSSTCDDGVCIGPASCASTSDCGIANTYCFSGQCSTIEKDRCTLSSAFDEDDVILPIGAIMPLTGSVGERATQTIRAATIAVDELNQAGGAGKAKFGLMVCDTEYKPDKAVEQAKYLSSIGINAIIGGFSSDETIQVANKVAIPEDVMLVSSSSTAANIGQLDDNDLIWRTVASDVQQGPALVANVKRLIDADENLTTETIKVALVNANSAYGNGLRETFVAALGTSSTLSSLVGSDNFKSISFEPADSQEDAAAVITNALYGANAFKPDVLILIGSSSSLPIIKLIEDGTVLSLSAEDKPTWMLSEAMRSPELLGGDYMLVWPRITGTVINQTTTESYNQFKVKFESQGASVSDYPFADKTYDAAYLIAMSLASFPIGEALSGTKLAGRFKQMTEGTEFQLTTTNFSAAVSELADDDFIDVVGASGDLNFDLSTGDVTSTIKSWSIDTTGTPMFLDGENLGTE